MDQSGLYVFCVIRAIEGCTPSEHTFGMTGLGGHQNPVWSLFYKDIGVVVTHVESFVTPSRGNLFAHEQVVYQVFQDYTVIPLRFGYTLGSEEDVLLMAERLYDQFDALLSRLEDRIEVSLQIVGRPEWLKEKTNRNPEMIALAEKIRQEGESVSLYDKVRLGELAEELYLSLQSRLTVEVHHPLAKIAHMNRLHEVRGNRVLFHATYLLHRQDEAAFDTAVNQIYERLQPEVEFKYTGPWPPYNFVDIELEVSERE